MMNFTKNADISGTYLQGYVYCSYAQLVKVFGEPCSNAGDGYKIDVAWHLTFEDGTVATIYNYKTGKNYLGSDGEAVENIKDWHIGGFKEKAVELVQEAINSSSVVE